MTSPGMTRRSADDRRYAGRDDAPILDVATRRDGPGGPGESFPFNAVRPTPIAAPCNAAWSRRTRRTHA